MERLDGLALVAALCRVSSSPEERLGHCGFAGEPAKQEQEEEEEEALFVDDDSDGEFSLASTEIMMVSPPETADSNKKQENDASHEDVFQTPPEESMLLSSEEQQQQSQPVPVDDPGGSDVGADSAGTVVVDIHDECWDDSRTVELGNDIDLGFSSEVELTQRIELHSDVDLLPAGETEVINLHEFVEIRVLGRELVSDDNLYEPLLRRSKISDRNLGFLTPQPCSGSELKKRFKRAVKSMEKLNSPVKRVKVVDENLGPETPRISLDTEALIYLGGSATSIEKLESTLVKTPGISDRNLVAEIPGDAIGAETRKRSEDMKKSVEKSCLLEFNSPNDSAETMTDHQVIEMLVEMKKSNVNGINHPSYGSETPQEDQVRGMLVETIHCSRESHEEGSARRKLQFASEVVQPGFEQNSADLMFKDGTGDNIRSSKEFDESEKLCCRNRRWSGRNSIDDIDKFRYVGPSHADFREKDTDIVTERALPASLCDMGNRRQREEEHDVSLCSKNCSEVTMLDVLRMVAENRDRDPNLEKLSFLEVAKRRGMSFPSVCNSNFGRKVFRLVL